MVVYGNCFSNVVSNMKNSLLLMDNHYKTLNQKLKTSQNILNIRLFACYRVVSMVNYLASTAISKFVGNL